MKPVKKHTSVEVLTYVVKCYHVAIPQSSRQLLEKTVLASAVAGDPALLTGFSKNGPNQ